MEIEHSEKHQGSEIRSTFRNVLLYSITLHFQVSLLDNRFYGFGADATLRCAVELSREQNAETQMSIQPTESCT